MSRAKERLKGGKETKDSVTLLPCFYFVEVTTCLSGDLSVRSPMPTCRSVCLSVSLFTKAYLSVCLSVSLFTCLSSCLSIYLLSDHLSACPGVCFSDRWGLTRWFD